MLLKHILITQSSLSPQTLNNTQPRYKTGTTHFHMRSPARSVQTAHAPNQQSDTYSTKSGSEIFYRTNKMRNEEGTFNPVARATCKQYTCE